MDEIVNKMIDYGKKLLGTKRYDWFIIKMIRQVKKD